MHSDLDLHRVVVGASQFVLSATLRGGDTFGFEGPQSDRMGVSECKFQNSRGY